MSDALIRPARPDDATRLADIARAAYAKYIPRLGREPAPMSADYAAAIADGDAAVIVRGQTILGYLIGRPYGDSFSSRTSPSIRPVRVRVSGRS